MIAAFQMTAFYGGAFQENTPVTNTQNYLTLPIDCVVIGNQPLEGWREYIEGRKLPDKVRASFGGALKATPSFTTTTSSRGY